MSAVDAAGPLAPAPETAFTSIRTDRVVVGVALPLDAPARITSISVDGVDVLGRSRLVELQLDGELRTRVARGYRETTGGSRLRPVTHQVREWADAVRLDVVQLDQSTGVEVTSELTLLRDAAALRVRHTVRQTGATTVVLRAVSSLSLAGVAPVRSGRYSVLAGRSDWLGEGRWSSTPLIDLLPDLDLPFYQQSSRGRYAQTGHGAWTTSEMLPLGVLLDDEGGAVAWQLESGAGWHWELADDLDGVRLLALGPTDAEHRASVTLAPGESFTSVDATVALGVDLDGVAAELTMARRRARRGPVGRVPVVYNDYMNTLMGQPSTEALLPLIAAAQESGAEVFCIDAGWFAEPGGDYWTTIGDWDPASTRFTGGLGHVIAAIVEVGMIPGLWLEPEAVGLDSPAYTRLPDEAFFVRDGQRVVEQRRGHLDLTRPAARAHVDEAIDRLVAEFGIGYVKLDYNIDPGVGTDRGMGIDPGLGLLEHSRAYVDWLVDVQRRHPGLLVETCASGAMRSDGALLAAAHIQSTSDQQNALHSTPIAASAPLMIPPEQAGDWAYPAVDMSDGETALTLANGLAGRLYLSGFLGGLRDSQRDLVSQAVELHTAWRSSLGAAVPLWPLGLPAWTDDDIALVLDAGARMLVLAWSRGAGGTVRLGLPHGGRIDRIFPQGAAASIADRAIEIVLPPGPAAVVLLIESGTQSPSSTTEEVTA